MGKQKVRWCVNSYLDIEGKAEYVLNQIEELVKEYGTDWELESNYYEESASMTVYAWREETDQEYSARLAREERDAQERTLLNAKKELAEKAEYERLKKKYG